VVTATVSKTWNDPTTVMIRTSARIGRSSGTVMLRNIRASPAPSIRPASYIVSGIVCRPAKISRAV
jgi:hypothetical protein